jgi:hypothetical protein
VGEGAQLETRSLALSGLVLLGVLATGFFLLSGTIGDGRSIPRIVRHIPASYTNTWEL